MLTLALRDTCCTIKISGGVPRAGDTIVLSELCLIRPHWAADTPVYRGVVVMAWRTLNCRVEMNIHIKWGRFGRLFQYIFLLWLYKKKHKLTFDFTVMKGAGTFPLSVKSSPTWEAQGPSQIWLVGALGARLTGFEPIAGEVPRWTLAWIGFVKHGKKAY